MDGNRMKPCNHTDNRYGCRLCFLYTHEARYRQMWGGDPADVVPVDDEEEKRKAEERSLQIAMFKDRFGRPCVHLGMVLEEKPSCGCGPRHACAKHGECVTTGSTDKWTICSVCPDYDRIGKTIF